MLALATPVAVTVAVAGALILLAVLTLLRVLLRHEPTPPRWRRYRVGLFVERDRAPDERDEL